MNRNFVPLLIVVIAALHNSSCAGTIDSDAQQKLQLNVGQTQLRLEDSKGMCSAIASAEHGSTAQYALDIPWPCRFHTDKADNVRTVQGAGYTYVLVESSTRTTHPSSDDCVTHLQSIRIKGLSVEISPHKDRVASCPPFQWDAILFKELFD
jgi:hypothetical protein